MDVSGADGRLLMTYAVLIRGAVREETNLEKRRTELP
jgi:hypothetical protein